MVEWAWVADRDAVWAAVKAEGAAWDEAVEAVEAVEAAEVVEAWVEVAEAAVDEGICTEYGLCESEFIQALT